MTREEIIDDAINKITEVLREPRYVEYITYIGATMLMLSIVTDASLSDKDITHGASKYLNALTREICEQTSKIWLEKQKKNLKVK